MKARILIVDDEPQVISALSRILRRQYFVDSATDPLVAVQMVEQNVPYDVVISDLMMPGLDGVDFLAAVKEQTPDTIRIMLTGQASLGKAVQAINEGHIFQFLTKPCSPEALKAALGLALKQRDLIDSQREVHSLRKLKAAFTGVVSGLAAAVESRDRYTSGHQARVARLGVEIAKQMGLKPEQIDAIRLAGLVHDIGKIYVPTEFLCKPGPLSDAEFAVIKDHARVGYEILKPMDFTWPISSIVLQHHERMDGSGYPQGLTGGDILVESRVIAVADVVDAIISDRPYRRGHSEQIAFDEITKNQGVLYDSDACDALLKLTDQWRNRGGITWFFTRDQEPPHQVAPELPTV